ncbi:hypothetical protein [Mangrovimonas cancribranchiae]|uniref:Uncharacterized protein n=1 Tax=Mangrovimonas cancribranchiae TaxID=3080055 RepID=A0AAU6NZG8_9FLAO
MSKTYIFQEYKNNEYQNFVSDDLIEVNINSFQFFEFDIQEISSFSNTYNKGLIPEFIINHLKELLNHYKLQDFEQEFISLLCSFQSTHLLYFETDLNESLTNDFVNAIKQKKQIIKALKLYQSDKKNITSIQFNPLKEKALKIDNWFLKKDIFNALIYYYGITEQDYNSILQDENNLDFKYSEEYIPYYVVNTVCQFLINRDFNQTNALKFIDFFLRIAQIKYTNDNNTHCIELYDNIEDNINLTNGDIKALRQKFIARKKDFLI